MNREQEIIEVINRHMPRSTSQVNNLFESDSEIVAFHGKSLLYNIDEFSEEDLLREDDPYMLGWNMATGSISDILASGGSPKFYAHSMVIRDSWTKDYVEKLSLGVAQVLKKVGATFIGGDFGISKTWRYTGSVIGDLEGQAMLRSGAKVGDGIFLTGPIGRGNVEAALKLYEQNLLVKHLAGRWKNSFQLRSKEAEVIKRYSRCCIDTSDGVFNALGSISEMSGTGFVVGSLPYVKSGLLLAKTLNLPKEMLFLGECGEYELLFTLGKEAEDDFLEEALKKKLTFYKIGEVKDPGIKSLWEKAREIDLRTYTLRARDWKDPRDYLRNVANFLTRPNEAERNKS
ncbi:thiamine-phosphate kinase [Desulfosporosinus nitroreducens]|uniref:Thiamine-phosphate kinase n=1 Tax=Desulfosporosinus nitroreducens TaxID=2018668 RepID=A0ABT8QSR0_9FIRM|nr:thiamine-phosphate kinase [Desulfosporosinus nitroreducens]MDO0824170.1 thiamine-phosphate kinase [Desulfosporosinus nitroreducens]